MSILLFILGLVLLVVGAEALVRGASRLASALGISPVIIGLTVVAFGTSSPELAVSVKSAVSGQADIALGNVVGSNVFNVLFILGLSALIAPLVVAQRLIQLDVPLMIALSVSVLLLGLDGEIGRIDGLLLFGGLLAYLVFLIRQTRQENEQIKQEYAREFGGDESQPPRVEWLKDFGFVGGGLALLVLGSKWLVASAVAFAQYLGVSELVIGLTIVAAGTSLPEVVTSTLAAIKGEVDIAVGNVVGSNLFNIMGVLGLASAIAPGGIEIAPAVLRFDIPVMIATALACLPIFFTGNRISRWEGALLLGYYIAYTLYLILAAGGQPVLSGFTTAMLFFVLPLTAITLLTVAARELRLRRGARRD